MFGFLDETCYMPVPHFSDAEAAGILDMLDADRGVVSADHGLEIDLEDRVAQDDEERTRLEPLPCEIDCMREPSPLILLDKIDLDLILSVDVIANHVAEIADDDGCLVESGGDDMIEDVADDRLSCDIQENFGKSKGMRPKPAAEPGDGDDGSHMVWKDR